MRRRGRRDDPSTERPPTRRGAGRRDAVSLLSLRVPATELMAVQLAEGSAPRASEGRPKLPAGCANRRIPTPCVAGPQPVGRYPGYSHYRLCTPAPCSVGPVGSLASAFNFGRPSLPDRWAQQQDEQATTTLPHHVVFLASRARHDAALSDGTGVYPLSDLLDGDRRVRPEPHIRAAPSRGVRSLRGGQRRLERLPRRARRARHTGARVR